MVNLSELKVPKIINKRSSGETEIWGLTAGEWITTLVVLAILYAVMVGYFVGLLIIAQTIRSNGNNYGVPGSNKYDDDTGPRFNETGDEIETEERLLL